MYANGHNSWGYPEGVPYYFEENWGRNFDNVDHNFPTHGKGITFTRSPRNNNDNSSGASSRVGNRNNSNAFLYQNISLQAYTTYTVSVYARAFNGSYDDAIPDHQFRFVYEPPGGSPVYSSYNTMPTYVDNWTFQRYSYTFTTGEQGTYKVGINPPYASCLLYTSDAADE